MAGIALPSYKQTFLGLVQNAAGELGLSVPSSVIGNSDTTAILFLYLANRIGQEVYQSATKNGGWTILRQQYEFPITSSGNITGTFTNGSPTITVVSTTANVSVGMQVVGYGFVNYPTTVLSKTSSTITMSANATANSPTGTTFYCGNDAYSLPSDFSFFINQTFWDGNFRWQLLGPLEAQEWAVLKFGISPTGPRRRFRIFNNQFYIDPVPNDNGSIIAYEYYSAYWAQSMGGTSGTTKSSFTLDTDNFLLDDDIMTHGLKWRYKQRAGLDYSQEKEDYDRAFERVMSRDGAARSLPLNASASGIRLLNNQNVPDTGFGS